jgi:hypothetical protein
MRERRLAAAAAATSGLQQLTHLQADVPRQILERGIEPRDRPPARTVQAEIPAPVPIGGQQRDAELAARVRLAHGATNLVLDACAEGFVQARDEDVKAHDRRSQGKAPMIREHAPRGCKKFATSAAGEPARLVELGPARLVGAFADLEQRRVIRARFLAIARE